MGGAPVLANEAQSLVGGESSSAHCTPSIQQIEVLGRAKQENPRTSALAHPVAKHRSDHLIE
jgi:hypothetical protein